MFDLFSLKDLVFLATVGFIVFCVEVVMQIHTNRIRAAYKTRVAETVDQQELEREAHRYYVQRQRAVFIRFGIYAFFALQIVFYFNFNALSFLSVALGALVVILKEPIVSLISYSVVAARYDIGDTIRLAPEYYGEIVGIYPLRTVIASKDERGDLDGRVVEVPNYQFLSATVEKQERGAGSYRVASITFPYAPERVSLPFEVFYGEVVSFLDAEFPMRTLKNVGHLRSWVGYRYKLRCEYDKSTGAVLMHISFVSKATEADAQIVRLIAHLESLRTEKK